MKFLSRLYYKLYLFFNKKIVLKDVMNDNKRKKCLLLYITEPFLIGINDYHQNSWQVYELARLISELGYSIDVVDYDYNLEKFPNMYDLVVDINVVGDRRPYVNFMNENCKKIAYMTGSDNSFAVNAEKKRLQRILKEKNYKLPLMRLAPPISRYIESFDAFFLIGNQFTLNTFSDYKLPPVYFIRNHGYNINADKIDRKPNNFIFFASFGQVHKGLDLLLEIFSTICVDCNLYVCSNFKHEKEFCDLYYRELYKTKNIYPMGFLNIKSKKFLEIIGKCTYMIVPSCSEGMMGSALVCMSAGIIPIMTPECGYDDGEYILIDDVDKNNIAYIVHKCACMENKKINDLSNKMIRIVKDKYTKRHFSESVQNALLETLSED